MKWVHFFSAGIDYATDKPIFTDTNIPLTTSSGVMASPIAEWCIMTFLVQSRHYNQLYEHQKLHDWKTGRAQAAPWTMRDMVGQRVGVLGYGAIGRQVARASKAMGMDVVAFTARPRETPEEKRDDGYILPGTGDPDGSLPSAWYSGSDKASLHRFLGADLDWLVVSVPLTPATTHFLGFEEFQILSKRQAFFTNISRGPIVKQDDLITALRPGISPPPDRKAGELDDSSSSDESILMPQRPLLRGAALDVTDPEPLPADNPLWDFPSVIVTPHLSGITTTYTERTFDILGINLARMQQGIPPDEWLNLVDRKRGY